MIDAWDPDAWDLIASHERERAADIDRRKQDGAFYTPPGLAADVAARALSRFLPLPADSPIGSPRKVEREPEPAPSDLADLRILDPAVGGGSFLLAAIDILAAAGLDRQAAARCCTGLDRDPGAIAVAQQAVRLHAGGQARLEVVDALLREPVPEFDVVLGNPPWEKISRLDPRKPMFDDRFAVIREGEINLHALFLVWGLRSLKPGGVLAMITPNTWLLNRWDALLRRHVLEYRLEEVAILAAGTFPDTPITIPAVVVIRNSPADRWRPDAADRSPPSTADRSPLDAADWSPAATRVEPATVSVSAPGFQSTALPDVWRSRLHAGMSVYDDVEFMAIERRIARHCVNLGEVARASDGIYTSTARRFATFDADELHGPQTDAVDPQVDPHFDPHFDPRVDPRVDPNVDPNVESHVDPHLDPHDEFRPVLLSGTEVALDLVLHGGARIPRDLWAKHAAAQDHERLVMHAARHPSLGRRLVGAVVPAGVYTSNRFINIVSRGEDPFFLAAVLLSRTIDFYFARRFPVADVDAFMLHQLPIPVVDPPTKARLASLARERGRLRRQLTTLIVAARLAPGLAAPTLGAAATARLSTTAHLSTTSAAPAAPVFAAAPFAVTAIAVAITKTDQAIETELCSLFDLTPIDHSHLRSGAAKPRR